MEKKVVKKRFTFAEAKEEIKQLKRQLSETKEALDSSIESAAGRVMGKDFYQGAVTGAIVMSVVFVIGILSF